MDEAGDVRVEHVDVIREGKRCRRSSDAERMTMAFGGVAHPVGEQVLDAGDEGVLLR